MADWSKSMQQTFEYYVVDPGTWKDIKRIDNVTESTIERDSTASTLGSANISLAESLGECYVRIYLITIQNGIKEKHPLGTYLLQTPYSGFDGKAKTVTVDSYTPLMELKENVPPLGYSILKETNIMETAYKLVQNYARAPVVEPSCYEKLFDHFVAVTDDTWLSFITDLISNAKYTFSLDEMGRILFAPDQDTASLRPVWTYTDDNSSILYPELSLDHDLYGIPNVVEVIYSTNKAHYYSRIVNDDPNSPISTVSRGREIVHRVTDPDLIGNPTEKQIDEYAKQLLRELSSLEYTVTYTHGYNGVRIGDCVRFNHERAELVNIKAKVIKQSIKCEPGCPVTETAVFTKKLWG
jgi:hypothetical protein